MAYSFQQRRTRLAWYVRDGDVRLIAEGMLEKARVEYVNATKWALMQAKRKRPLS